MVRVHENQLVRCHQDHVRKLKVPDPNVTNEFDKKANKLDATKTFSDLDLVPDTVSTPSMGVHKLPVLGIHLTRYLKSQTITEICKIVVQTLRY